ncbi:MAG: iron chelate uptake ABC transporter family permease subunit, partial [Niameybacter sp.]
MKRFLLIILMILLSLTSLLIGASGLTTDVLIISRVPRLVSLIMAGVGMSISGLIMQQLSQNKFVSPTTGATIDAAQLGIVIAMVMIPGATMVFKTSMAFIFALTGTVAFMV